MSKSKTSYDKKIKAVSEYKEGKGSLRVIAEKYNVSFAAVKEWIKQYKTAYDSFKNSVLRTTECS